MQITEEMIPYIEKALDVTLYTNQRLYLIYDQPLNGGRKNGKTFAYCIKLALTEGEPLDMKKPETFSDGWHLGLYNRDYSVRTFRWMFMDIREKLRVHGFKVRDVVGEYNDYEPISIKKEEVAKRLRVMGYEVRFDDQYSQMTVMLRSNASMNIGCYITYDELLIDDIVDRIVGLINERIIRGC